MMSDWVWYSTLEFARFVDACHQGRKKDAGKAALELRAMGIFVTYTPTEEDTCKTRTKRST